MNRLTFSVHKKVGFAVDMMHVEGRLGERMRFCRLFSEAEEICPSNGDINARKMAGPQTKAVQTGLSFVRSIPSAP
jgi:hypothetical protein